MKIKYQPLKSKRIVTVKFYDKNGKLKTATVQGKANV